MTSYLTRLPWVTKLSRVRAAQEAMVEMEKEVVKVAETEVVVKMVEWEVLMEVVVLVVTKVEKKVGVEKVVMKVAEKEVMVEMVEMRAVGNKEVN